MRRPRAETGHPSWGVLGLVLSSALLAAAVMFPTGVLAAPRADAKATSSLSTAYWSTSVRTGSLEAGSITLSGGDLLGLSSGVLVVVKNTSSVPLRTGSAVSFRITLSGLSVLANASAWVCSGAWVGSVCTNGTATQFASTLSGGTGALPAWAVPRGINETRQVIVKSGSVLSTGSVTVGSSVAY